MIQAAHGPRCKPTDEEISGPAEHYCPKRTETQICTMSVQEPRADADLNAAVGGYLRDLAFAQSSQQKMFGYKRAANAILALDVPLSQLCAFTSP